MVHRHDPVDVVTVGGGFTASIIAAKALPGTSLRMVSIEQGAAQATYPHFAHNHDSLRYSARFALMQDLSRSTWTWRPDARSPALPMRQYGSFHPGEGLGGSIVHWSGQLWRFTPYDFRYRSWYVDRYGEGILPEGSAVQDWPVTYEELEPYYDAFEYDLGASGRTGNLAGAILPGGNPFEGPRSRPYPLPPLAVNAYADLFAEAASAQGLHPFPQPSGILSEGWVDPWGNERAGCLYCGFCTRFGCEVDAKGTSTSTFIPVGLATGRWEIRTGSTVLRIETGPDGRATGVRYVDAHGEEHVQPAAVVCVCAFTLETVRTLLVSSSDQHPAGIGGDRGRLGRNYSYQLFYSPVKGLWDDRRFQFYMGNTCTIDVIYDYYATQIDHGREGFIGGSQVFSQPCEREPVTSIGGLVEEFVDRPWGAEWKRTIARSWDSVGTLNLQGESPAYEDNRLDLDPHYVDAWGRPLLRLTFEWKDNERRLYAFLARRSAEIMRAMGPSRMSVTEELQDYNIHQYQSTHPTGGAIMGADPGDSVANSYGQVWDTPNVFVFGAALFPQNAAANPSGTVAALAYRTAEALRDRYFRGDGDLLT